MYPPRLLGMVTALVGLLSGVVPSLAFPGESAQERDSRMAWFREARFGMFIHWGLYALPAGEWEGRPVEGIGEWIQEKGKIPMSAYAGLVPRFNPVDFDADAWVRLAKAAGMRYIVITSKHHDGFALWRSRVAPEWSISATPFDRDSLRELADACARHGIVFCLYHSIMDWHHPDYAPRRAWNDLAGAHGPPRMERYVADKLRPQLRELLTGYGRIGILWFDGEWEKTWTREHGEMLDDYVRALQPGIIVNNRVDKGRRGMQGLTEEGGFRGDYGTPEQEVPATGLGPGVDWESCMTMNDTWGFKTADGNWKSAGDLIRTLVDIASKGGNFLLNVGPTAAGRIPGESVDRLREIGKWMDLNGEAIRGTSASPFRLLPWGRVTAKGNRLYLHVFQAPVDGVLRLPLANAPLRAVTLGKEVEVEYGRQGDEVWVRIPAKPTSPHVQVIALDLDGPPVVNTPPAEEAVPAGAFGAPGKR
jgi:alpha-L-fucosidase